MVNMNAADDKQNNFKSTRSNGISGAEEPCSSATLTEDRVKENSHVKLNGNSSQSNDYNEHPIANGAYSNENYHSNISSSVDCDEPSVSRKCVSDTLGGKSNVVISGSRLGEIEKDLIVKKNIENHTDGEEARASNAKRQPNPVGRSACDYDKNSSSEDEECCIYTYRGDSNQMADLPSSFFRLDLMSARPNASSRNSSPDMDYLEMDFDPGPSNDRFSSSDSEDGEEREELRVPMEEVPSNSIRNAIWEPESAPEVMRDVENARSPVSPLSTPSPVWLPSPQSSLEQSSSSAAVLRSPPSSPLRLTAQAIDKDISQTSYCYCISNKLSPISIDENFNEGDSGTMIWKEQEAKEKQVTQIGKSLCGATAVINTLLALNVPFCVSAVKHHVATRFRNETAPVVEYLLSRSNAGATHEDIIRGLHGASHDLVYARFFHMYPQRSISLTSWLSHWIRKGAVPIATLNLQRGVGPGAELPDWWHHQMVYGVGVRGVYLTNPLEVQSEARMWPQLASPAELKVQSTDVLSRWTPETPLHPLIHPSRPLWRQMNVLGQVVNVIREGQHGRQPSAHVTIPASYSSGVTLAVLRSSPAYDELRLAPELPVHPFAKS